MAANILQKKIGIIIQARMNSIRLPGKVMLQLAGGSVLQHIIDRLKDCNNVSVVVIATTDNVIDDVIADFANKNSVRLFRGSESDVLSRFYHAACQNSLEIIVRVTADSPLVDPQIIDEMVSAYLKSGKVDYLSNTLKHTFPLGFGVEIFSFEALKQAYEQADKDYEREHVTPYIYEHPEEFVINNFESTRDFSQYRLTLDTSDDYILIKAVYEYFLPHNRKFRLQDIINFLESSKSLSKINAHVKQRKLCE